MSYAVELLPTQRRFFECPADVDVDVALYQGGFGSGKTWIGCLLGLTLLQKEGRGFPGFTLLVTAQSYPMLRDTTIKQYLRFMRQMGMVEGKHYRHNKSENIITFPIWNGAEILFRSVGDNPESIRSINAGAVQIEEATLITETAFRELLGRLRQLGRGKRHRMFMHSNPQAVKGWVHRRFVEQGGLVEERMEDGTTVRVNFRRLIAPTVENPHLPPGFIATLKSELDPDGYRVFVLGEDGDYRKGLVVKHYSDENRRDDDMVPGHPVHISCDFNVDPCMWVIGQRFGERFHVFDEIVIEDTNVNEMVDELAARYPADIIKAPVTINGDASGGNRHVSTDKPNETSYVILVNRLKHHGYRDVRVSIHDSNPPILSRVQAFNSAVCDADGRVRFTHHSRCKWLRESLENERWKEGTSQIDTPTTHQIKQDPKLKYRGHIFDAVSYWVEYYQPIKHARPKDAPVTFDPGLSFDL